MGDIDFSGSKMCGSRCVRHGMEGKGEGRRRIKRREGEGFQSLRDK